jgi:hypothetical protein
MWNAGRSASEIAKALEGRTRNAIIGHLHRLGYRRSEADRRINLSRLTGNRNRAPRPRKAKPPKLVIMEPTTSLNIRLTELRANSCRWPIEHDGDEFRFCGLPTEGAVYCSACIQRFRPFIPAKPHRVRAA